MLKMIICKDCGEMKKQESLGLCCKCYKKQYRLKKGMIPQGKYWGVNLRYEHFYDKCIECVTTEKKHHAMGLCTRCYRKKRNSLISVCKGCKVEKKRTVKGLCYVCYNKQRHLIKCEECKKEKPYFAKGLCKTCYHRLKRQKNIKKAREKDKRLYHKNIDKVRKRKQEWSRQNIEKVRLKAKRYYAENTEREKKRHKLWVKNNLDKVSLINRNAQFKRRSKLKKTIYPADLPSKIQRQIFERDKGCVYKAFVKNKCNEKLGIEHIIPIEKGGSNDYNNLVVACERCNSSKNTKDVFDWCREKEIKVPKIVIELLNKQKEQKSLLK